MRFGPCATTGTRAKLAQWSLSRAMRFAVFESVALCLFTTHDNASAPTRVRVEPSAENGLERTSFVMTEKIASVSRDMLGKRIGVLENDYLEQVSRALMTVLGLD